MNPLVNFFVAINGLKSNKLRSALTMLGIIIGVAAVIIMISIGQGVGKKISDTINSMGTNLLTVTPGADFGPVRGAGGNVNTLTVKDAEAIAELSNIDYVVPQLSTSATISYGSQTWTTQVEGTTPGLQNIKDLSATAGGFLTEDDVAGSKLVAVIGQTIVDNLYPAGTNPLGTVIRINKLAFTVVGVLAGKGSSAMGQVQDDVIYIPITTAQIRLIGGKSVRSISVQVSTKENMDFVQNNIEELLRSRHRLSAAEDDDFTVRNQASLLETAEDTTATLTWLLASIAAISLLVGGIGIMNIMLVSVTERTKEIGLRMAVGATDSMIRNQFLVESIVLCLIGGVIGIVLGMIGSTAVSAVAGWSTSVSAYAIILSFGFSAAIGVFFGYYPASKAAKLNPIEALRSE